jgi:serine/threonine-protein kinase
VVASAEPPGGWDAAGLAGLGSATTVRATIDATRQLADAATGPTVALGGEADATLALPPGDTLPTLPAIPLAPDVDARGAGDLAVVGLLGEGGMGRVLLVRQRSLARDVAVKVAKATAGEAATAALIAEARVLGRLEHPSIVPVHALGRDAEGGPVLVMKRVEGVPWSALLADAHHALWADLATAASDRRVAHLETLVAVCGAAHYAHRRGVVHRDLKPDNVMIGRFGEVYVTDWGLAFAPAEARRGGRAPLHGTPAYMAPEMLLGDLGLVDERTDVYLLGAILHEILTGTTRNPGRTVIEAMRSAAAPTPVAYGPDVPEELAAIANRATAADRADRFPTAQALQRAIAAHLRHEGAIALARAASAKLEALRSALATPPSARSPEEAARVERLATECRFAFVESLRAWGDQRAARAGLAECVALEIRDRVTRGDAHGARALLGELADAPGELEAEVAAAEAAAAGKSAELARLAAIDRDLDPAIAARERATFMGALLAATLVLGLLRLVPGDHAEPSAAELLAVPSALFALTALALALGGGARLGTKFNRRAGAFVLVGLGANVVHRVIALHAGEPSRSIHRTDSLLLATVLLSASVTQERRVALGAVPLVVGAALMPPSTTGQIVTFGVAAALATAIATLAVGLGRAR